MSANVYKAMLAILKELGEQGISKEGFNQSQKFKFRGIDQVYEVLNPLLAKHGILIIPLATKSIDTHLREKEDGKITIHRVVTQAYRIAHESGEHIDVELPGEAQDGGDKTVSKCLSIAYKYIVFQAFCVPVEGQDDDPDAQTVEFRGKSATKDKPAASAKKDTDTATIGVEKGRELGKLLLEANVDVSKFLESFRIGALPELPASKLAAVTAEVQARIQANKQAPKGDANQAAGNESAGQPAADQSAGTAAGGQGGAPAASNTTSGVGTRVSRFRGTR